MGSDLGFLFVDDQGCEKNQKPKSDPSVPTVFPNLTPVFPQM
jgi:hypothetical protein